ncbi:MAG: protein-L-isoaspartate carboxylmethyltransferase [Methanomicrobiales archaeon]|jgi:tRNA (adenine57-N1/adenine58-N1)-methyltransferase|nr:protein-L-isoaspartate carboxylmethyltransferase [Methanomicrobiales archaeon]
MIQEGDLVLLRKGERRFLVRACEKKFSTDKGVIDLGTLAGLAPGDRITTHTGVIFEAVVPRTTDLFEHGRRSGAPMLPKDIGIVTAYTGMNRRDRVFDAGTGSGVAALFFGGIAREVVTCEYRPDFADIARKNLEDAGLENVTVVTGDLLTAQGTYDIVHLDMALTSDHIQHATGLLTPGGFLACYSPFIEQLMLVMDTTRDLFSDVHSYEVIEREMTRSARGTRPATRVSHTGYITIARR